MNTFTPNTPFLAAKFNEYNATYFDGKLPMVRFRYNRSKRQLGEYDRTNNTICITLGRPEMTEHDCEEILIHEMVHAWQNYMGRSYWNDGHRGCFIRKANEINRKSNGYFHISRCGDLENGHYQVHRNTDYVKLLVCTKKADNHIYVGRVLDESKFEWRLGKHYEDIKCYEASGKELEGFVKSIKTFHYKTMIPEKFDVVVKPCLGDQIPFNNRWAGKAAA